MGRSVAAVDVTESQPWSAVVLAAGRGERLGGLAKSLIQINGEPLLVRLLRGLLDAGAGRVVCVTSSYDAAMREAVASAWPLKPDALAWVQVEQGLPPGHSLQQGLAALQMHGWQSDEADAAKWPVMVCLADQPFMDASTLQALMQAYAQRPPSCEMVVPWVQGKPCNPVVLTPALAAQWFPVTAEKASQPTGKAWREQHPDLVYRWPTDKVNYWVDIDTPHDVESLRLAGFQVTLPPCTR
jgi:molybdenum cofactor cytidylyltransferase